MSLEIRRAQPQDREAVLAFCAHTWEFGDYIAEVWDDWLADEQGPLLVATLGGEVVALEKISWSGPAEAWLEGMRVHPDYRRRGIATHLFHYALEWLEAHQAQVARLATASDNRAIHRMIRPAGFRHVHTGLYYTTPNLTQAPLPCPPCAHGSPLPAGPAGLAEPVTPTPLPPSAAPEVWAVLERSGWQGSSHGLYAFSWAWQPLTPARLEKHLQAGQVVGERDAAGTLQAIAIVEERADDPGEGLVVGLLEGCGEALSRLAYALRVLAGRCQPPRIGVLLREDPDLLTAVEAGGLQRGWEAAFWVFEGRPPWKR